MNNAVLIEEQQGLQNLDAEPPDEVQAETTEFVMLDEFVQVLVEQFES